MKRYKILAAVATIACATGAQAIPGGPDYSQKTTPLDRSVKHITPGDGAAVAQMPGFVHHYADVNGTRLHYVRGGTGPAVVLIHGWPYSWYEYRKIMPLLAAKGYTVIAPDYRGAGDSRLETAGYSKANVAEDIHQLVTKLGFNTAKVVGGDIGMMIAFSYALNHPNEVDHLVLGESMIPGFGLEEGMNPAAGGYWHFGFQSQVDVATLLTQGREAEYILPVMKVISVRPDEAVQLARTVFLPEYIRPGRLRAGYQHYATLLDDGKYNRAHLKAKLTMPVMGVTGAKGMPHAQMINSVRQVADHVEDVTVPVAGHSFSEDNPVWTADRLDAFFKK